MLSSHKFLKGKTNSQKALYFLLVILLAFGLLFIGSRTHHSYVATVDNIEQINRKEVIHCTDSHGKKHEFANNCPVFYKKKISIEEIDKQLTIGRTYKISTRGFDFFILFDEDIVDLKPC